MKALFHRLPICSRCRNSYWQELFFSIDTFPKWLQPICNVLPLTHLNDAMRNIAFEGSHLVDCGKQLGILGLWGVVLYAIAIKVFRWE